MIVVFGGSDVIAVVVLVVASVPGRKMNGPVSCMIGLHVKV